MNKTTFEIPIVGMDCEDCTRHVQQAIAGVAGVQTVTVYLGAEKAVVVGEPDRLQLAEVHAAVRGAGYTVGEGVAGGKDHTPPKSASRQALTLFGLVFMGVLFVVVFGEWLGLFERLTTQIPWFIGWAIVLLAGYPVFRNVIQAALRRQIISHTLMTLGVIAALAVGEWATAAVVVFFMRVGDYAEHFTTDRARRAVRSLAELAPQMARVERDGQEIELPVGQVVVGEVVIVRPGEKIPVDGRVLSGRATLDQAAITGEAMPVEAAPGTHVYAATLVRLGSVRVVVEQVGPDTTFGRVIQLVEEAEAHRGHVQRIADRVSGYYLPVVAGLAVLTWLLRRDPLAAAAVLVVACSCSFALATPIAMLASIGAAARRGILFKGGKHLETLARATVLLVDKTGTLTLGQPQIVAVHPLNGWAPADLLRLAASAERYSEHPLAEAVRQRAGLEAISLSDPEDFTAQPGVGVTARVGEQVVAVGNRSVWGAGSDSRVNTALAPGQTGLYVAIDGIPAGLLAAVDTIRLEVPAALQTIRAMGIHHIELLTGDNPTTAAALAGPLGIRYQAGLLPEDKIRIVRAYQADGQVVVMVGDGVNDAPALAQADVGIAMGAVGTDIAIEAAHVALLRDDWALVPAALQVARRTMRVVHGNLAFTVLYNLAGLSLAALGFLPPILAAAAQSLPDLGILANSARLLRQRD